jgi:hypothetical protein
MRLGPQIVWYPNGSYLGFRHHVTVFSVAVHTLNAGMFDGHKSHMALVITTDASWLDTPALIALIASVSSPSAPYWLADVQIWYPTTSAAGPA